MSKIQRCGFTLACCTLLIVAMLPSTRAADRQPKADTPGVDLPAAEPDQGEGTPSIPSSEESATSKDPEAIKKLRPKKGNKTDPQARAEVPSKLQTKTGVTPDKADAKMPPQPISPAPIFPDKGLEDAVRREVFSKRYNDEPITKEDVANLSRVIGKSKQIKNLEGLQHCRRLMLLDLENNEIVDLTALTSLPHLQSVTLAGNQISDLAPLANLKAMQRLDLSRNQINDLSALTEMTNLRTLYVAENLITNLEPISTLEKMWSLDVAGNQIKSLRSIDSFTWLTMLEAGQNRISTLDFVAGLRQLRTLSIGKNPIKDFSPLVDTCESDASSDRRFAPYLDLYLSKDQLDHQPHKHSFEKLKAVGVDILEAQKESSRSE